MVLVDFTKLAQAARLQPGLIHGNAVCIRAIAGQLGTSMAMAVYVECANHAYIAFSLSRLTRAWA